MYTMQVMLFTFIYTEHITTISEHLMGKNLIGSDKLTSKISLLNALHWALYHVIPGHI